MRTFVIRTLPVFVPVVVVTLGVASQASQRTPDRASTTTRRPDAGERPLLDQYCVGCHNQRLNTAGLALDTLSLDSVTTTAATWEKVVAKLRSGAMPPVGRPRPTGQALQAFIANAEGELDRAAAKNPNPGKPAVHRLNRAEYVNAIRDLLDVDVDASALLPPDDSAHGFDNIADILTLSSGLLERYMAAAQKISRAAVGDPTIRPITDAYRVSQNVRQEDRPSEDLPWGTRGGLAIRRYFAVDGNYTLKVHMRYAVGQDDLVGLNHLSIVEVRVDGAPVDQFTFGRGANYGREGVIPDTYQFRIPISAGAHVITVGFQNATLEPENLAPRFPTSNYSFQNDHQAPPRIDFVELGGPYDVKGASASPSRRRIFVCQPTDAGSEGTCARTIVSTIARHAYRLPVEAADVEPLLAFYRSARQNGSFDDGIQAALERILVSPQFLFRAERVPENHLASNAYRISDLELASRLSFFLWSSIPDDELLDTARQGTLHQPAVLAQQVRRMIADGRSRALVENFAGQWLQLRDLQVVKPDPKVFPDFDDELRAAFKTETELFVESQLHDDRSVADLLSANYTFLNERLAAHYGVPNVYGSHFRRVALSDGNRGGILGQASILTVTSYANRTSPTLRGKWILQNILGAPPPAPPPNVPALEEQPGVKYRTMRERMEQHRKNPACAACHARIDPLGFAMENFDGVGRWRTRQGDAPIDASGSLDGTAFNGAAQVTKLLVAHKEEFVTTVTEKLLTYALGRGLDYYDMPAVRQIMRRSAAADYRWSSIVLEIVNSTPFQMRRSES